MNNQITPLKKAKYIIALVKSVNKSLEYALSIVCWYTSTEKEEEDVKMLINEKF